MTTAQTIQHLSTTQLRIGYQSKGREICVAETPELHINAGDFICLLGPNGAGKSTLIRTLAGIQAPLQGTVTLDNQPYESISPRERARKISIVLTETPPLGLLDAYSLVALGRHPHSGQFGTLGQADRNRIDWALQVMDALKFRNSPVAQLSDGERQKLLVARALAQETPLMLLDEPTAFLDLSRRVELMATLRRLVRQEDMGILLSTHDLDLALRFADRIWLLNDDGTLLKGYPEELVTNGAISRTFSTSAFEWDIATETFHIQENSNLSASVHGEGSIALWTRRALGRLGFTVVDETETPALKVRISNAGQQFEWHVDYNGCTKKYSSIEAFIASNSSNIER